MDDASALVAHWGESPPLIDCVRAYLGIKPGHRDDDSAPKPSGTRELAPEVTPEQFEMLKAEMDTMAARINRG